MKRSFEQPIHNNIKTTHDTKRVSVEDHESTSQKTAHTESLSDHGLHMYETTNMRREKKIIAHVAAEMRAFVAHYGGVCKEITPNDVSMYDLPQDRLGWLMDEKKRRQTSRVVRGLRIKDTVAIYEHDAQEELSCAIAYAQALIRQSGFNIDHVHSDDDISHRALEISMRHESRTTCGMHAREDHAIEAYYDWMADAIVAELTERFMRAHYTNVHTPEAIAAHQEELRSHTLHKKNDAWVLEGMMTRVHAKERTKFNALIDLLYEKNGQQFSSREDVFAVFARAHFTGRLVPLARLIDGTVGSGACRRIAQEHALYVSQQMGV